MVCPHPWLIRRGEEGGEDKKMKERLTGTQKETGISKEQRRILDLLNSLGFADQVFEKLKTATSEGEFLVPPGFPLRARQILYAAFDGVIKTSLVTTLSQESIINLVAQEEGEPIFISINGGVSPAGGEMTILIAKKDEEFGLGIRGGVFSHHLKGWCFFERKAQTLPVVAVVARDDEQRRYGGRRRIDISFNMPDGDTGRIEFVKKIGEVLIKGPEN